MPVKNEGKKTGLGKRNLIKVWQPTDLTGLELQRGFSVNRPVPRHSHDEYQFCLVESGQGDLTYRGKDFPTPPASLFVVHPGEVHSNRAFDHNGCSFRTIFLAPAVMEKTVTEMESNLRGLPFFPSTVIFDKSTLQPFVDLHVSLEQSASILEREIRLQNFLVKLTTGFAENPLLTRPYKPEQKAVKRAFDYLVANYAKPVSLEKLAAIANLSPFHFNRVFTKQFGMPPHAFQVHWRVSQAKKLLREGLDIAQTALHCGFADQSHLNRHFKRIIGITPGQYK